MVLTRSPEMLEDVTKETEQLLEKNCHTNPLVTI